MTLINRVVGITMVRDEEDVISSSINNLMRQGCEGILVADNMSVDSTPQTLKNLSKKWDGKVITTLDNDPGYYQSKKMTDLAFMARNVFGNCWIVPFDADEMWYSKYGKLADILRETEEDVVYAPVWHMLPPKEPSTFSPVRTMEYRREEPERFPVVAFRYDEAAIAANTTILQGNHDVVHPGWKLYGDHIEVKHYQYRSLKQFTQKVRNGKEAYDATDLPYGEGFHWREYGKMTDEEIKREWDSMCDENGIYDPFHDKWLNIV